MWKGNVFQTLGLCIRTIAVPKEILLSSGDETSRAYVTNFISDYLGMSEVTAGFFNCTISKEVKEKN